MERIRLLLRSSHHVFTNRVAARRSQSFPRSIIKLNLASNERETKTCLAITDTTPAVEKGSLKYCSSMFFSITPERSSGAEDGQGRKTIPQRCARFFIINIRCRPKLPCGTVLLLTSRPVDESKRCVRRDICFHDTDIKSLPVNAC